MQYTGNLNLKKPEGTDTVNIDDLNDNADIIDSEIGKIKSGTTKVKSAETADNALKLGGQLPAHYAKQSDVENHINDNSKHVTNTEKNEWNAKETPAGAQAKANTVQQNLESHLAEKATEEELGHVKVDGETISINNNGVAFSAISTNMGRFKIVTIKPFLETLLQKEPPVGISDLSVDNNNLYFSGSDSKLYKFNLESLEIVGTPVTYGNSIKMVGDESFLYAGFDSYTRVVKINKTDLSQVAVSAPYTARMNPVAIDDDFVYAGSGNSKSIVKLNKSDLSLVATSPEYAYPASMITDETYIYVSGGGVTRKLNKSNLTEVASSPVSGSKIVEKGEYIYVTSSSSPTVCKLNKSDMALTATSPALGTSSTVPSIAIVGDKILASTVVTKKIAILDAETLSLLSESEEYSGTATFIASNEKNTYFYAYANLYKALYYENLGFLKI